MAEVLHNNDNPRVLPARTVTRRDALRLLIGAGAAALAAAPLRALAEGLTEEDYENFSASDATNEALSDAQDRYNEVSAELDRIGREYADLSAQHAVTLDEIERVTGEIAELEDEIERKQDEIEHKQQLLGERMSTAYKTGNRGVLELLFSAANFEEFTSNVYYLDKITASDRQMIEDIKAVKEELEQDKLALEDQKTQLEALRAQEEAELEQIRAKQGEVEKLLNQIDSEVAELIEQRDAEILEAKERAEELERQRQAALEAAAAAAAAAEAEAAASPSSSSNGGGSSVYGEIDYGSGSTGSQSSVVDAASWTPSTGAGYCAAWVSNVFSNAGVGAVYGNACDMYWAYCYSSNLADITAGMIIAVPTEPYSYAAILYGHVGIYIGNGLVRHCISGYVTTQSLDSWISQFGVTSTPRWGWLGGIVLG